jgi:colicin import membrane protein
VKPQSATPHSLEKRRQPGSLRAIVLAVAVHAAFFALIVFGVTWQSRPETPVQAELWDKLPPAPVAKAPEPKPVPPKPEPPKPEPPKPEPKPEPPAPKAKPQPPKPDPAIAQKLEREKREKEKKEKEKVERERRDKQQKEEERAKREAEKAREEMAVAKKAEIDSFVQRIKDKIRSRANIPDTVTGSPEVQVRIRVLPGGEVLDITVTKRSGNPTYDAAIERGIRSAQPLPVPAPNSELFPQFRDLTLNIKHER